MESNFVLFNHLSDDSNDSYNRITQCSRLGESVEQITNYNKFDAFFVRRSTEISTSDSSPFVGPVRLSKVWTGFIFA